MFTIKNMETEKQNVSDPIVKKKGRPRKLPILPVETEEPEKKKRGRKKKEKVQEEEVKQKKKRGRKAAIKFFSSSIRKKIPLITAIHDTEKTILHLDIKDESNVQNEMTFNAVNSEDPIKSELDEILNVIGNDIQDDIQDETDILQLYEKRLELRVNQDQYLTERLDNLHNDENLFNRLLQKELSIKKADEIQVKPQLDNQENRKKKFFNLFASFYQKDEWLNQTDIACWWCCHQFDTVPIGFPVKYQNNKFQTRGIFCSFACAIAHNKNEKANTKDGNALIHFLYKKLTGIQVIQDEKSYRQVLENTMNIEDPQLKKTYIDALVELTTTGLESAPPRCTLKMFGGELSIEEFRKSSREHTVYKLIKYPMSVCRDYVEEVDIQNVKNKNSSVFNKPSATNVKNVSTPVPNTMDRFIKF